MVSLVVCPNLAKETKKGGLIVMNIETFEQREQMLKLRERVLKAEQERIEDQQTVSVSEARMKYKVELLKELGL